MTTEVNMILKEVNMHGAVRTRPLAEAVAGCGQARLSAVRDTRPPKPAVPHSPTFKLKGGDARCGLVQRVHEVEPVPAPQLPALAPPQVHRQTPQRALGHEGPVLRRVLDEDPHGVPGLGGQAEDAAVRRGHAAVQHGDVCLGRAPPENVHVQGVAPASPRQQVDCARPLCQRHETAPGTLRLRRGQSLRNGEARRRGSGGSATVVAVLRAVNLFKLLGEHGVGRDLVVRRVVELRGRFAPTAQSGHHRIGRGVRLMGGRLATCFPSGVLAMRCSPLIPTRLRQNQNRRSGWRSNVAWTKMRGDDSTTNEFI